MISAFIVSSRRLRSSRLRMPQSTPGRPGREAGILIGFLETGSIAMNVTGIDHYTLRCRPDEMDELRDFYGDVLGLKPGPRPDFAFPGHWLYCAGFPVVHIAATLAADTPTAQPSQTGRFDHLSFRAHDVLKVQAHLNERGIVFKGSKVPGFPLYQLFFYDPAGVKVELTFAV